MNRNRNPALDNLLRSALAKPVAALGVPIVEFDGFRFEVGPGAAMLIPMLDLIYRARRYDEEAAALLNAFHVSLKDASGRFYWPKEEEPVVQPEQTTPALLITPEDYPNS